MVRGNNVNETVTASPLPPVYSVLSILSKSSTRSQILVRHQYLYKQVQLTRSIGMSQMCKCEFKKFFWLLQIGFECTPFNLHSYECKVKFK